jgi:hypothetical protein
VQEEQSLRRSPRIAFFVIPVSGLNLGLMHYAEAEIGGDVLNDVWGYTARLSGIGRDQSVLAHGINQARNSF